MMPMCNVALLYRSYGMDKFDFSHYKMHSDSKLYLAFLDIALIQFYIDAGGIIAHDTVEATICGVCQVYRCKNIWK